MSITITLHNSDVGDLFVSVADLNLAGGPLILTNQRINADQTFPINVQEDGNGSGNVTWSAQRADDASKTAQRTTQVSSGSTVDVTTFFG
jgi:hypothetical protein